MEVTVYLALGSNLGNRIENIEQAYELIEKQCGPIQSRSKIYETPPMGFDSSNYFLNSCISIHTNLKPADLLCTTQQIEKELGRKKKSSIGYADRSIDIDIIFYNSLMISDNNLMIPHPKFRERLFVLKPLTDIAEDYIDPVTKSTIQTLLNKCVDKTSVSIYQLEK